MAAANSVFKLCRPRPEVLAGMLPDAIFAADLWEVISGKAHPDYQDPKRFFAGTHATENLRLVLKDVAERLAGVTGGTPVFVLETNFGGGKTHTQIGAVHVAREGDGLATELSDYGILRLPKRGSVRAAAFVGEESDPLRGKELIVDGKAVRTFTPWGQIALMAGGLAGYELVRENDEKGGCPDRSEFAKALGDGPVLILIDELVLYMARAFALDADSPRARVNSQWSTFFQVLFSLAANRPETAVLLTVPSEQDANRAFTGNLRTAISEALSLIESADRTTGRHARNVTPTQTQERGAVLAKRLFERIDRSQAEEIAQTYADYYEKQREEGGVQLETRAFEYNYRKQIADGYPFHPELIRLFAERLADIPEFQATRGALRLVARTIRAVWENKDRLKGTMLLQPHHVDLTRSELRDEVLGRLGRSAFERALDADVISSEGAAHANEVDAGWPWKAASEASLVAFLHSLPDGSRGVTATEVALAIGRPGCDLAYVARGLEETERSAWYMRREGDHFFFRTRASVNKRFQERLADVKPAEIRETLDGWVQEVYSGFDDFQVIPFPQDHNAIPDKPDRVRLAIIHYDRECGAIGGGERLNFTKSLFAKAGANATPRRYKNNVVFLLAESTRVDGLKSAVSSLIAWERVQKDIETEQKSLAQTAGSDFRTLKHRAQKQDTGVPAEFIALESDLGEVREKLGVQELNVRTKLLEAYRVLAFPMGGMADDYSLFASAESAPMLECFRVDFGEDPDAESTPRTRRNVRQAVAEAPLLDCLRDNHKLVPEPTPAEPVVLTPGIVRQAPLWLSDERRLSTEEVWDRIRREPGVPMVLRPTDLLPTFRAGLCSTPDAHWVYYDQGEKRVYTRSNADGLSPVLAGNHLLYDPAAAIADRIMPVTTLPPQELWDHLWPRRGTEHVESVSTIKLLEAAKESPHFPVLPERSVVWQALQEGTRENRWILYLRGPNLAIGAKEMNEWPGTPRFDDHTEIWAYQAAIDHQLYPRKAEGKGKNKELPLTPTNLRSHCWPQGSPQLPTEDLERYARGIWSDLSRPRLETLLRDGLGTGEWSVWEKSAAEAYFTRDDQPSPAVQVGSTWVLVDPGSPLAQELEVLRPGHGPQPIDLAGTPRQVLTDAWEALDRHKDVRLVEMTLTASDRETFDNTVLATWADKPNAARVHVSVLANGQREADGKQETVSLSYEGRFEEVRGMLSPIWPFSRTGELEVTIAVQLFFDPAIGLADEELAAYRKALMNANQGNLGLRVVPSRGRRGEIE
ncbi:MAG: ATP-binding protein [Candidatus Anammoximicrobium sp.]|nr:ATP-binding protein [Candidatus Anammoximicrobium sp.]